MEQVDNINKIANSLKIGEFSNNPHGAAEAKAVLAGEYSFWMGILEDVLTRKPEMWNKKRQDFKSDTACERWWESTADGINEIVIRLKIKRIEKLMSALSTLVKLAEHDEGFRSL